MEVGVYGKDRLCGLKDISLGEKTKNLLTEAGQGEAQVILWIDSQEDFKFHSAGYA